MGCRPPARASVAQTSSTTGYPPPHYSAYTQQAYSVLRLITRADSSCQRTRLKSVSSHYSQMVLQQSSAQPGIYSQLSMERILPTCGSVQRTAQTTGNRSLDRLTSAIGFCFFRGCFDAARASLLPVMLVGGLEISPTVLALTDEVLIDRRAAE